jgi:SAM-dependent methyltransferase
MLRQTIKGLLRLSTLGSKVSSYHMNRYYMYRSITAAMAKAGSASPGSKILSVSWSEDLVRCFTPAAVVDRAVEADKRGLKDSDITIARYRREDDPESVDIRKLPYPDGSYDFVAADQVLEHVDGRWEVAFSECSRVLKPGGIAILTTCLLQEYHEQPHDYIRVTSHGLRLFAKGKFSEVIEATGWGNKLAFFAFRYMKVPEASWHPVNKIAMWNDPEAPMLTWIILRK